MASETSCEFLIGECPKHGPAVHCRRRGCLWCARIPETRVPRPSSERRGVRMYARPAAEAAAIPAPEAPRERLPCAAVEPEAKAVPQDEGASADWLAFLEEADAA